MSLRKISRLKKRGLIAVFLAGLLAACGADPLDAPSAPTAEEPDIDAAQSSQAKPKLGLMSSLPLYWPLGADFADIAGGEAASPWQRDLLEQDYKLILLDTLTPIPGLTPDAPETDPLAELDRIAVIQPRGLSPADNAALDDWVRAGGRLLIALDPLLTGDYDMALGDPRRPTDAALIPPVIARWGLAGSFDPSQTPGVRYAQLPGGAVPLVMAGEGSVAAPQGGLNGCRAHESGAIVRCDSVGKGTVTYLNDAAVFEHSELAGVRGEAVAALLEFAFADN